MGNRHARPLVLLNNGYFPVQVSSEYSSSFTLWSFIMLSNQSVSHTHTPPGFASEHSNMKRSVTCREKVTSLFP